MFLEMINKELLLGIIFEDFYLVSRFTRNVQWAWVNIPLIKTQKTRGSYCCVMEIKFDWFKHTETMICWWRLMSRKKQIVWPRYLVNHSAPRIFYDNRIIDILSRISWVQKHPAKLKFVWDFLPHWGSIDQLIVFWKAPHVNLQEHAYWLLYLVSSNEIHGSRVFLRARKSFTLGKWQ